MNIDKQTEAGMREMAQQELFADDRVRRAILDVVHRSRIRYSSFSSGGGWPVREAGRIIVADPLNYRFKDGDETGFVEFLVQNIDIWIAFCRTANEAHKSRRMKGWSAQAVVEVLRYKSALREKDSEFKINNNWRPLLGRLYNAVYQTDFLRTKARAKK